MRTLKSSLLFLSLLGMLITSCSENTPTITQTALITATETNVPTATSTLTPVPTFTPTITATNTLLPSNEPGLIVTLGEKVPGPWHWGRAAFSPDGQIIAHASAKIRLWNVDTHELIQELKNPYAEGCTVADAKFSPDGRYFAVSIDSCWKEENRTGHLVIWDMSTYELIQDWPQEDAHLPGPGGDMEDYIFQVHAMTFLPNSTGIVYGSGNTLQIKDVLDNNKQDVLKLGNKMYATQISTSSDGRLVYIVMDWPKDHNWPSLWTEQYKLQIWNINTHAFLHEKKYPEGWAKLYLELLGTRLVEKDFEKATSQVINLETEEVKDLPFLGGRQYYNSDASLMLDAGTIVYGDTKQTFELWNTDTWRNMYTLMADFGTDWIYGMHDIAFSPDNKIIAIEHGEQVSLWNVSPVVQP